MMVNGAATLVVEPHAAIQTCTVFVLEGLSSTTKSDTMSVEGMRGSQMPGSLLHQDRSLRGAVRIIT